LRSEDKKKESYLKILFKILFKEKIYNTLTSTGCHFEERNVTINLLENMFENYFDKYKYKVKEFLQI
jgi:hypothetical protein